MVSPEFLRLRAVSTGTLWLAGVGAAALRVGVAALGGSRLKGLGVAVMTGIRRHVATVLVCLLCGMLHLGTPAQGAPDTMRAAEVSGTVSGYFLTPDEHLTQRTLQFTSEVQQATVESLIPLRCRYLLVASLSVPRAVTDIRLETRDGRTVWRQEVTPPSRTARIPADDYASVVVPALRDFRYTLRYRDAEGRWESVPCGVCAIEFQEFAEPDINWADLVRIEQLRAWLAEYGEEVLPGLGSVAAPFALLGNNDQAVLVDHPSPPSGFHPYHGPNPTAMTLQVGPLSEVGRHSGAAWTTTVGGDPTGVLPYVEDWSRQADEDRQGGIDLRTRALLLHEACHCVAARRERSVLREGPPPWQQDVPPPELRVLEWTARSALEEAGSGPEESLRETVRDFLALHDLGRERSGRLTTQFDQAEQLATEEGFCYLASAVAESGLPELIRVNGGVDYGSAPVKEKLAYHLSQLQGALAQANPLHVWTRSGRNDVASVEGMLQMQLLQRLRGEAIRETWINGETLVEALAHEVGYDTMAGQAREGLGRNALTRWQYEERLESMRAYAREQQDSLLDALENGSRAAGDTIEVVVRLGLFGERGMEALRTVPVDYLQWYEWHDDKQAINVAMPLAIRSSIDRDGGVVELRWATPRDGPLPLVRREGDKITMRWARWALLLRDPVLEAGHNRVVIASGLQSAGSDARTIALVDVVPESEDWSALPLWAIAADGLPDSGVPVLSLHLTLTGCLRPSPNELEWSTVDLLAPGGVHGLQVLPNTEYEASARATCGPGSSIRSLAMRAEGDTIAEAPMPTVSGTCESTGHFGFKALTDLRTPEIRAERDQSGAWQYVVTLTPRRLTVRVSEQVDRQFTAVAGIEVVAWPPGHPEQQTTAVTDSDGRAVMEWFPASVAEISVLADDHCSVHGALTPDDTGTVTVCLHRHFGISGDIEIERGSGLPADATPTVEVLRGDRLVCRGEVVRTGDGKYSYETPVLPTGTYTIVASSHGRRLSRDERVRDECTRWFQSVWHAIPDRTGAHHPLDGRDFVFAREGAQ